MDRIDRILLHPVFLENLELNREAECDRVFCRHDMEHFLDVARIGVIIALEDELDIDRELIYGAALLHDIGKHLQYGSGIPHEQASADIAPGILTECGFDSNEVSVIVDAILFHRDSGSASERNLRGVLYRADKMSRPCFSCRVRQACNWKENKKNLKILY